MDLPQPSLRKTAATTYWTTSRRVCRLFVVAQTTRMNAYIYYPLEFSSNVYGWDFAISIFSVALYSHRSKTVCEPFPSEFCEPRGRGGITTAAVTEVVRCLEQIPPVRLMADDKRNLAHLSDWALQVKIPRGPPVFCTVIPNTIRVQILLIVSV